MLRGLPAGPAGVRLPPLAPPAVPPGRAGGISVEAFYDSLWLVMASLVKRVCIQFSCKARDCQAIANGSLQRQRKAVFRKVIGAVDGILIKTKRPTVREYPKPVQVWCCKGFYGLNVQAICDAHNVFTFVSIDCPASVHDSLAFHLSTLGQNLEAIPDGNCPAPPQCVCIIAAMICSDTVSPGHYLLADAGYAVLPPQDTTSSETPRTSPSHGA